MAMTLDVAALIKTAKLGRARKDAQVDTCTVFAAALHDVLLERDIAARLFTASPAQNCLGLWAHALVEVDGRYFDSLGEFSTEIHRARAKIHPKVECVLVYRPDHRDECFEPEFDDLHAFYVEKLQQAASQLSMAMAA